MNVPLLRSRNDNKYRIVNAGSNRISNFLNNAFSLMFVCASAATLAAAGEVFPPFCSGATSHPAFWSVMIDALSYRARNRNDPDWEPRTVLCSIKKVWQERFSKKNTGVSSMADSTPSLTHCTRWSAYSCYLHHAGDLLWRFQTS